MKLYKIILALLIPFPFLSCSSVLEYKVDMDRAYDPENGYTAYDSKNGIRWLVNYNETHVSIHMDTDNPSTIFKLAYGGFTLYFDPVNPRGKSYYLKSKISNSSNGSAICS